MVISTYLTADTVRAHNASGAWRGNLLDAPLAAWAERDPERRALVEEGQPPISYGDLNRRIAVVARQLLDLGLTPGDVVAWQLPNWWETVVVHHAILRLGCVSCPIVPIYREREVGFIMRQTRAKVLFVPERFRNFDYPAMAAAVRNLAPELRHVIKVRSADEEQDFSFEKGSVLATQDVPTKQASDITVLLYTSGTTADPKGVLHSHDTIDYENRTILELYGLVRSDVVFMPSPLAHITGVLYGLHLPFMIGAAVVLQPVWEPLRALQLIQQHRCSFVVAATPFLHGLTHHPALGDHDVSSLRVFACGGADVPAELILQAERALGCLTTRVYGSTELPTLSAGGPGSPLERRATTDGALFAGAEARIVDEQDRDLPPGVAGDLIVRAPELFLGYLDAGLNADAFTADGWFRTGDIASLVDDWLTIHGRRKDIIIRGGENISAKEIEDLLFQHPGVADVAVIGMPDAVLVERVCAYIVPRNEPPTLEEVVAFLRTHRIANQKLPERMEVVAQLPRTASGKIQKFKLRADIAAKVRDAKSA
ncbi:AMP-binding protein [Burkholderia orbicola]|uniref:AMP-binding protein n=1 Tax=Burkholderia orbicola TaxID=2978683 RepID=UPI0039A523EF